MTYRPNAKYGPAWRAQLGWFVFEYCCPRHFFDRDPARDRRWKCWGFHRWEYGVRLLGFSVELPRY
jgi:hypothetical protein